MKPSESLKTFQALLRARQLAEQSMTGKDAWSAMTDFYKRERVDGCEDHAQDMLLFQWGIYDWGEGPSFQFDITRQLIVGEGEDDEIFQLRFTLHYAVSDETKALKKGNHWCESPLELQAFQDLIHGLVVYQFAAELPAKKVGLSYGQAG